MKTITRLYILQVILIGAIITILMVLRLNSYKRLNLFLKSSQAFNERMVDNILKMDLEVFMRPLHDNSEWDKTVQYIENPTKDFEEECLNTLLATFSFNHIMVFNQNGDRIYYINDSDSVNLDIIFRADQIKKLLTPVTPFCNFFININNELVEISGATVVSTLDTKHTLPAKGYIFFARNWNTSVIRRLEEITGSKIQVRMSDSEKKQTAAEDSYTVSHNLYDLQNRTVARLVFTFSAKYFQEWQKDSTILALVNIFIGLFIILIIGFLSRKWLVVPLKSLIKALDTGENKHLQSLKSTKNEFGEMARLIEKSIITENELKEEIINRLESEKVLSSLKDKAEESDRLKSTFLANMSHEIRTPMNAIVGFSGMLNDPDLSDEDRNRFSEIIQSRSDDLLHIINDILEISRIESGNAMVVKGEVDIKSILREIEKVMLQKLKCNGKTHISLICDMPLTAGDITFISDPFIIKQAFYNLIDNAIKFTQIGSIRFGYHPPENGNITCFVSDTGIGIALENQALIFEHFRQAETKDLNLYGGTGLGLSICKGSLELLGGKIWVESSPGKGSTFYFSVPFEQGNNRAMDQKPTIIDQGENKQTTTFCWKGKKLLLVEDDCANMEYLQAILKQTEAELICVYSGNDLRNLYDRIDTFDIVLLDIRLPDASGWDLVSEIKTLRPGLPVIAQTAYAISTDKKISEDAGCDGYISKPINMELLLNMISKFI